MILTVKARGGSSKTNEDVQRSEAYHYRRIFSLILFYFLDSGLLPPEGTWLALGFQNLKVKVYMHNCFLSVFLTFSSRCDVF